MAKRIRIIVPVVVVVGAVAAWLLLRNGAGDAQGLTASGTVEATEADLGFQVPGRVAEVVVQEGDVVSGGQLLAVLDTTELRASRDASASQLEAAEARLAELRRGARPEEIVQAEAVARSALRRAQDARRDAQRA
ncbi:MAG: biotin/lipoyl-binding protein, partial [Gemmatimonadota bacterium]